MFKDCCKRFVETDGNSFLKNIDYAEKHRLRLIHEYRCTQLLKHGAIYGQKTITCLFGKLMANFYSFSETLHMSKLRC